ncbi:MAG: PAS domain S-box protein [Methanoregula sp.]|nr:PAS domain S-box protein [Methanoregula sp.]
MSIFSLRNGYYDIFPYFYILPILLLVYISPRYAVYFTVFLGWIFLGLVWLYGPSDIQLYASSIAFFYIFISLGIVLSAFSSQILQERKYREIFENSQAGILTFDLQNQQIQTINVPAAGILGYRAEDLAKRSFMDLWFDGEHESRFIRKIRQDGKITDMEIALRRQDRTVIWVLATASLTKERLIVCSMVDITESKRVKDELIESELRYRMLFDGASDAVILHDIDGKIYETNVIASRYLGYSKKEFLQMGLRDLAVRPETIFPSDEVRQFLARGYTLFESDLKKKDGGTLTVEISSRTTEYFGMPAIMSTVRDISGRRKPYI